MSTRVCLHGSSRIHPARAAKSAVHWLSRALVVVVSASCGDSTAPDDTGIASVDASVVDAVTDVAHDARPLVDAVDAHDAAPGDGGSPADAAPVDASTGPRVTLGGTASLGGRNDLHDLAIAADTSRYRAMGGRLYVHELGWAHTSEADRQAIVRMYPDPPVWETGMPAFTHAAQAIHDFALRYWPGGVAVACVNGVDISSTEDLRALHAAMVGRAARVGAYFTPNSGLAWRIPWNDRRYDNLRAGALIGGALCSDAPPGFYLGMEPSYRAFVADEIKWATSHGVLMVSALYPRNSVDEWADTRNAVADLARQGAIPDIWAVDAYYSDPATALHPIGNELTPTNAAYTALQLVQPRR